MASNARMVVASWALLLALSAACPPPCSCPPAALMCVGCPRDYLTLANDTQVLSVTGCRDIQYFLKLHRPHVEGERTTEFVLHKLEITDSSIDKIPASYLSNDYPIQSLNLSNNSIDAIDAGLEAQNLTHLDLSKNRLSYIANRTFHRMNNMLYLDLSANVIKNLSVDSFIGLGRLAHLDISQNNLTFIMDATFFSLSSLQQLNLSYNMLEILSEKCFSNLLLLQQLDISYNRLTSVAPGTLQFLPNLAKLLLADNPHLKPDAQIFVGTGRRLQQVDASRTGLRRVPEALTHSVRYLSLAGNRIATLRCGDLDGYPLLHMLDFADNIIEYVEDDALGRLEMISRLFLNKNKLHTVPKMLPDKLSYLSMDKNLIENLTIIDFATLTNLKVLILSNNIITYIQENAFTQLASLEELDVSSNPLQVLTPNTFSGPISLKKLYLSFVNTSAPAKDISFPVPSPEGMEELHLQHSAGLTRQLLADTAALAAMARMQYLDISYSNISIIRSDLLHFFPQLRILRLDGNRLNCTELNWLADWMRENILQEYKQVKCSLPNSMNGRLVIDLPHLNQNENKRKEVSRTLITNINSKIYTPKLTNENVTLKNPHYYPQQNINDSNVVTEIQENIKEFFKSQRYNATNSIKLNKINQMDTHYQVKSLLDFQNDDQHHMNFKIPKKVPTQDSKKMEKIAIKSANLTSDIQKNFPAEKESSILVSYNLHQNGSIINNRTSTKKINKEAFSKKPTNQGDGNKLLEIFSQLSQSENNTSNPTNDGQKVNTGTQENDFLCFANGNLNGTENKTKCLQHPEIATERSEKLENKNIKSGRFIYRKNGNLKSSNTNKPKKSKYVVKPRQTLNTSDDLVENGTRNNQTNGEMGSTLIQNQRIKYDASNPDDGLQKQIQSTAETITEKKQNETKRENGEGKKIQINKSLETKDGNVDEENKNIPESKKMNISKPELVTEIGEHVGENVSEHQTSRFRAEESVGSSSLGLGVLVGVMGAVCAALAAALLAKRQPRRRHLRTPEIMEVQTISAVGELW